MKNFISSCYLILALLLSSCSNEESTLTISEVESTVEIQSVLVNDLKALNDSLITLQATDSRGFMTNALTFCAIAGADAAGAYEVGKIGAKIGFMLGNLDGALIGAGIGGLIGGVGASYGMYCTTRSNTIILAPQTVTAAYVAVRQENPDLTNHYPTQISLRLPENKRHLQEIGANHNLVLKRLSNQDLSLTPVAEVLSPTQTKIIQSVEFEEGYYTVLNSYIFGNYDTYVDDNGTVGNTVMKLYLDIMNRYPDKANDVEFISNKYVELISSSPELTEEDKDILYSAISVAVSSFEYWENEL